MTRETSPFPPPNGPIAAALAAAGLGCATLGVVTTWAEASPEVAESLNWFPPVGPLSGKAGTATATFFLSWLGLHLRWRRRSVPIVPLAIVSGLLLGIGLLGTFPPFFQNVSRRRGE